MKVLLFGRGSVGQRHERNLLAQDPSVCLVVAEPDYNARAQIFGDGFTYEDWWTALAEHPNADAAIIASPSDFHLEQARALSKCRIPFLVEKPACRSWEAKDLEAIVERFSPRAAVGFCYRFHPAVPTELGASFRSVSFFARDDLVGCYGPTCPETMGSHSLDLARYLIGPIRRAELTSIGGKTLWGKTYHPRGTATYDLRMDTGPRKSYLTLEDPALGDTVRLHLFPDDEMYRLELKAFLDYALGGERDPRLATLADGLEVACALARVEMVNV